MLNSPLPQANHNNWQFSDTAREHCWSLISIPWDYHGPADSERPAKAASSPEITSLSSVHHAEENCSIGHRSRYRSRRCHDCRPDVGCGTARSRFFPLSAILVWLASWTAAFLILCIKRKLSFIINWILQCSRFSGMNWIIKFKLLQLE